MAEEQEEALKTDVVEDDNEVKKILGLAQPLFIKIAIALLLVIILAVGAIFFLSADEEMTADIDEGEETTEETIDPIEENAIALEAIQSQLQQVESQNASLIEQLNRIENQLNPQPNNQQDASDGTDTSNKAILNTYSDDATAFPPIDTTPPQPKPEPSWGEFKRAK